MAKMSKKERNAKARAYAKKMTHGKGMDIYAVAGAPIARIIDYSKDGSDRHLKAIVSDFGAYDPNDGSIRTDNLVRGYGGSVTNAIERKVYRFLGIRRPTTDPKTAGDVLDYITYHGAAAARAWEARHNLEWAHQTFYRTHFGINLSKTGWAAIEPDSMIMEKEVPYILQKKIRQIPFIKRQFAKLNKAFGGMM